jgi:hypothetical protein
VGPLYHGRATGTSDVVYCRELVLCVVCELRASMLSRVLSLAEPALGTDEWDGAKPVSKHAEGRKHVWWPEPASPSIALRACFEMLLRSYSGCWKGSQVGTYVDAW